MFAHTLYLIFSGAPHRTANDGRVCFSPHAHARVRLQVASPAFVASMVATPALTRHVAVVGNFHCGKTMLLDLLVAQTQAEAWDPSKDIR